MLLFACLHEDNKSNTNNILNQTLSIMNFVQKFENK